MKKTYLTAQAAWSNILRQSKRISAANAVEV
jgi:hypothetical protein